MRDDRVNLYNRTWELCVENVTPETDKDKNIVKNMTLYGPYFKNFSNKLDYVKMMCSFWTYGVVNKDGWVDMESRDEFDWTVNFYDRFIKNLSPDTKITIYECTK